MVAFLFSHDSLMAPGFTLKQFRQDEHMQSLFDAYHTSFTLRLARIDSRSDRTFNLTSLGNSVFPKSPCL